MTTAERLPRRDRALAMTATGMGAAVYATVFAIARLLPTLRHPDAVAAGMTVDLVVVVPLVFHLLVVKRRGWPVATLAPVVLVGALAAALVLPQEHRRPLRVLEMLAIPIEACLLGWIAWRAVTALRAARRDRAADPLEVVRRAALDVFRLERVAGFIATEAAVVYYGLGAWRSGAHAPAGVAAFTHHRRAGHIAIVSAFILVMAVEAIAVHILVSMWSAPVAWVLTAATAYATLWLVADARATVLRPLLVDGEALHLRAGLRFDLRVPRARIADVTRRKPPFGRESLNLTLLGAPSHWIVFTQPLEAEGPYGMRRRVRAVGIQPDDTRGFDRVLGCPPS